MKNNSIKKFKQNYRLGKDYKATKNYLIDLYNSFIEPGFTLWVFNVSFMKGSIIAKITVANNELQTGLNRQFSLV